MNEQFYIDTIETLCMVREALTVMKSDIDSGVNVSNFIDKSNNLISLLKPVNYRLNMYKENYERVNDDIAVSMYKAINEISKYFDYYVSELADMDITSFYNSFKYIRDSVSTMTLTINVKLNFMYGAIKNFVK